MAAAAEAAPTATVMGPTKLTVTAGAGVERGGDEREADGVRPADRGRRRSRYRPDRHLALVHRLTDGTGAVAAVHDRFEKLGVEFLAVSTDSRFVHKIWQEQELSRMVPGGVPFPMLSDSAGHIGRAYGVYDDGAGVDVRGSFLIDPEGIVQAIEMLTPPVGRNVEELERQVSACQVVHASRGTEATPAGWRPGEPTLKPGPGLVGRVWEVWKPRPG
jgi:alkyl hydroperoxide reductase subunit AhpC